jgi:hypothetical protein
MIGKCGRDLSKGAAAERITSAFSGFAGSIRKTGAASRAYRCVVVQD